jgi:hypothetical protein
MDLNFAALEELIFLAAGAARAFEAANKQNPDSYCHQDGEKGLVGRKPMDQSMHFTKPTPNSIKPDTG